MPVTSIASVTEGDLNCRQLFTFFIFASLVVQETKAVNNSDGNWRLIAAAQNAVYALSSLGDSPHQIYREAGRNIISVACDARNDTVFWTNVQRFNGSVTALSNNGSTHSLVDSGLGSIPDGIAYDWITGNIYIAEGERAEIVVCGSGVNLCSVLVNLTDKRVQPRAIALHPNKGLMFWTDWGQQPAIMRAGMDGSLPQVVISTGLKWPNGICIDFALDGNPSQEHIFWVDAYLDRIETAGLDGSGRRIITNMAPSHPFGIDVFGDRLFWSDWIANSIKTVNKFTGLEPKTHAHDFCLENVLCPNGIVICDIAKQPIEQINPCGTSGCSHICVLSPLLGGASCICPVGMTLDGDMKTCAESQTAIKLFVEFDDTIKFLRLGSIGRNVWEIIQLPELESITALVYNPLSGNIVVSDRMLKRIYEYNLVHKKLDCLVNDSIGVVADMDIDGARENLYWVDSEKGTLEVISLLTRARLELVSNIDNPVDILVVNEIGCIFVSTFGKVGGRIHKFLLNGSNHTELQTTPGTKPIALHYAKNSGSGMGTLSWIDGSSGAVRSALMNGNIFGRDAETGIKLSGSFSDAVFHGHEIYYWDSCAKEVKLSPARTRNSLSSPNSTCKGTGHARLSIFNKNMDTNLMMTNHDCSRRNGNRRNCSHICLPIGDGTAGECRCPAGLILNEDLVTCELNTPKLACLPSQFACKDGSCINRSRVCDGAPDCAEEDDEKICGGVTTEQVEVTTTATAAPEDDSELPHESTGPESESGFMFIFRILVVASLIVFALIAGLWIYKRYSNHRVHVHVKPYICGGAILSNEEDDS